MPLHMKRESQVPKYLNLVNKGGGSQGLERTLGHLLRIMAKGQVFDFQCFLLMDGLGTITSTVINPGMQEDSEVSKKYEHMKLICRPRCVLLQMNDLLFFQSCGYRCSTLSECLHLVSSNSTSCFIG